MAFRFPFRWQFSLRTMLIVVTLLAIGCAYMTREMQIISRRNSVRLQIEKSGGIVWSEQDIEMINRSYNLPYTMRHPTLLSNGWIRCQLGDQMINNVILPGSKSAPSKQE